MTPAPDAPIPSSRPRSLLDSLLRDLRHAVRVVATGGGFTVTVLLTLTLCIGAVVAVFGVFDSVVLSPLPFEDSERLVVLNNAYPGAGVGRISNAVPDYFDRREQIDAFEEVAIFRGASMTLLEGERPERVNVGRATPSLFPLLRVDAFRGRLFTEDEGEVGNERKALLTYETWRSRFGADEDVLGRPLRLDGEQYTVVGVLEPGMGIASFERDLWIPAAFTPEERSVGARHSNSWQMLARLAPGATLEQARVQIDALNERNLDAYPQFKQLLIDARFHTLVGSWREDLVRSLEPKLGLLLGGALFVLLIGCLNIANLVLVRTTARMKQLATRCALGAGRGQVARQLVLESLALSLAGGALGLAAGAAALRALTALGLEEIPRGAEIGVDLRVALPALAVSALLGVAFGLIPAIQVFREDLSSIFREDGRTGSSGRGAVFARNVLVVVQVAFAFVLLIGAGFLLTSFVRTAGVDPGFRTEGVLTARISLPGVETEDEAWAWTGFYDRLLERARAIPGVESAGLTDSVPFGGSYSQSAMTVEGYEPEPGESIRAPYRRTVSPGFFETLDVPVLAGRVFDERDRRGSQRVLVVDRWLAERYWPDGDAVGGRISLQLPDPDDEDQEIDWWTVVGVVEEIVATDLAGDSNQGAYYLSSNQLPGRQMTLALATDRPPEAVTAALRAELHALDPELPLYDVLTLRERIEESLLDVRLPMLLAVIFAIVALFLSAVGIYGVLAYAVAQRTRELGIRLALGSSPGRVFGLVARQGLAILGVGFGLGLAGALLLTRTLESLVYGVTAVDPTVYLPVALALAAVVTFATVLPARRATRVDPVVALSSE
ncbi:MAG: ABC transporter permease [Acidobacteriota bacterium]|jgi:predicted permease